MRSQRLKDLYFLGIQPLARLNAWRWRLLKGSRCAQTPFFVNLGCGEKYLPGFFNLEGNILRRKDLWVDLRNPLPFRDNSVDALYACHVFEHFFLDELKGILNECHRVLKGGGGLRILVPSLEQALAAYIDKKEEWFSDFPTPHRSLGGKISNFLFCDGQHRLTFDFSFFEELLSDHGFRTIVRQGPGQSDIFPGDWLARAEPLTFNYIQTSLVVEARK